MWICYPLCPVLSINSGRVLVFFPIIMNKITLVPFKHGNMTIWVVGFYQCNSLPFVSSSFGCASLLLWQASLKRIFGFLPNLNSILLEMTFPSSRTQLVKAILTLMLLEQPNLVRHRYYFAISFRRYAFIILLRCIIELKGWEYNVVTWLAVCSTSMNTMHTELLLWLSFLFGLVLNNL